MRRLLVVLLASAFALVPGTARAQGATAQAWWNSLPAASPDVGATDLLLQGGDPVRVLPETVTSGLVDASPMPTSIGALRFETGPDSTIGPLVLSIGAGGQAMDVRAYATTTPWQPAQGGPIADAPKPDLTRYSLGVVSADMTSMTFADIGKLATESGELSVVLYAGAADRVVVHHPTATALVVTQAPPAAPVVEPTSGPVPAPVVTFPALPVAVPPVGFVPAPAAPTQRAPLLPTAAPQAPAQPIIASRVLPSLVSYGNDSRTRLLVSLEALLVAIFFGLLGVGPLRRLSARPEVASPDGRGIGRFRTERTGPVPRL